jgi:hypothetical protein
MSQQENQDLANVYLNLYLGCIKYKEKNIKKKEIECEKYYDSYKFYLSRLNQDNKSNSDNKNN